MITSKVAATGFPGFVVSGARGTNEASLVPTPLQCNARSYPTTPPVIRRYLSNGVCASPPCNYSARSASAHASGANHRSIDECNFEKMQRSFDSKINFTEQKILEHVKLQCHVWQTIFDSRLNALEAYTQKDANEMVKFEDRFSAIEDNVSSLLEPYAWKHQQSLDLNDEVAKIKNIVSHLQNNFGRNLLAAVHQHDVEQKGESNKLSEIIEDGHPVIHEHVRGIDLAHQQERVKQQGPDQKQELANSMRSFEHRLCVVECNIDQLAFILKNTDSRLSYMNGHTPASKRAGSRCRRSNQTSTGTKMTCSKEDFELSGAAHQSDAETCVCGHHAAFTKESACVSEHVGHPSPVGITNRKQQEEANGHVEHGHGQMQFMLAKAEDVLSKWRLSMDAT